MIESLMPSEVARLVLGYLKEKECIRTIGAFLVESPDLKEYFECLQRGREHSTKIAGKSLLDVLNEYCAMNSLGDSGCNEIKQAVARMESCVGHCRHLLHHCGKHHSRDSMGRVTSGVDLHSIAQRASSRISLTVARQSQEKPNSVSSSTNFVPVPIILNTNRKTSLLERVFASGDQEAVTNVASPLRGPSTNPVTACNPKVSFADPVIKPPCPVVSGSPMQWPKTLDRCGDGPAAMDLGTPAKLRLLSESTSSKSPRRKSNTPRKLGGSTALVKSTNAVTTPIKDKADCAVAEETTDLNALLEELLHNTALHERIAENINKVVGTSDAPPVDLAAEGAGPVGGNCLPQLGPQDPAVPNDIIKNIIDRTESDPAFEAFMNLICGKPDYSSGDGSSCSPVSILSDAMSNLESECSNTRSPYVASEISNANATPDKFPNPNDAKLTLEPEPEISTTMPEACNVPKDEEEEVGEKGPLQSSVTGTNAEDPKREKEICGGDVTEELNGPVVDDCSPMQLTTLTPMECDSFPVLHIPEVSGCSPLKSLGVQLGIDSSFASSTILVLSNSNFEKQDAATAALFQHQPQFVTFPSGSVVSFTNVPCALPIVPNTCPNNPKVIQDPKKQSNIRPRILKRQLVGGAKTERPAKKSSLGGNPRKVFARNLDMVREAEPCDNKQPHVRILDFNTPRKDTVNNNNNNMTRPGSLGPPTRKGPVVTSSNSSGGSKKKKVRVSAGCGPNKAATDKEVAETLVSLASGIPHQAEQTSSQGSGQKEASSLPVHNSRDAKKPAGKTKNILSAMDVDKFLSKLHYVE